MPNHVMTSLSLATMLTMAPASGFAADSPRPCIVPLDFGVAGRSDRVPRIDLDEGIGSIPGFDRIVFHTTGSEALETIDSSAHVVPFVGRWPIDKYDYGGRIWESWSQRVLAWTTYPQGLFVSDDDRANFVKLSDDLFWNVSPLPRRRLSLAISAIGGVLAVDGSRLVPWHPMTDHGVVELPPVVSFGDMPSLSATLVLDRKDRLQVLTDDDRLYDLMNVGPDEFGRVFDAPGSRMALYVGQKIIVGITKGPNGSTLTARTILKTPENDARTRLYTSTLFAQAFLYGRHHWYDISEPKWMRLDGDALIEIGGAVGEVEFPHAQDLPTLKRIVFRGSKGLFLYDGTGLKPIVGLNPDAIIDDDEEVDLPSLGRVVLQQQRRGLRKVQSGYLSITTLLSDAEITADAALKPLPAPLDRGRQWIDWPMGGGALVTGDDSVYLVKPDLTYERLKTPTTMRSVSVVHMSHEPATGGVLLTGAERLYLAIAQKSVSCDR